MMWVRPRLRTVREILSRMRREFPTVVQICFDYDGLLPSNAINPRLRFLILARLPVEVSRCLAAFCLSGLLMLASARAGEPIPDNADGTSAELRTDKSQYNLFHPTPDDLLRDFSSSRPDQTTGAHSVDAGHFYLETGTAYSLGLGAKRTDTWDYGQSTHFRAGLTNNIELELIWSGVDNTRTRSGRSDSTITGSTDLTIRTRLVLVGNDSKTFAFSIDPEITVPTQSHHIDSEYVRRAMSSFVRRSSCRRASAPRSTSSRASHAMEATRTTSLDWSLASRSTTTCS